MLHVFVLDSSKLWFSSQSSWVSSHVSHVCNRFDHTEWAATEANPNMALGKYLICRLDWWWHSSTKNKGLQCEVQGFVAAHVVFEPFLRETWHGGAATNSSLSGLAIDGNFHVDMEICEHCWQGDEPPPQGLLHYQPHLNPVQILHSPFLPEPRLRLHTVSTQFSVGAPWELHCTGAAMSVGGVTFSRFIHTEHSWNVANLYPLLPFAEATTTMSAMSSEPKPVAQRTVMSVPLATRVAICCYSRCDSFRSHDTVLRRSSSQVSKLPGLVRHLHDLHSCVQVEHCLDNSCQSIRKIQKACKSKHTVQSHVFKVRLLWISDRGLEKRTSPFSVL